MDVLFQLDIIATIKMVTNPLLRRLLMTLTLIVSPQSVPKSVCSSSGCDGSDLTCSDHGSCDEKVSRGQAGQVEVSYREIDLQVFVSSCYSSYLMLYSLLISIAFALIEPSPATQLSTSVMVNVY